MSKQLAAGQTLIHGNRNVNLATGAPARSFHPSIFSPRWPGSAPLRNCQSQSPFPWFCGPRAAQNPQRFPGDVPPGNPRAAIATVNLNAVGPRHGETASAPGSRNFRHAPLPKVRPRMERHCAAPAGVCSVQCVLSQQISAAACLQPSDSQIGNSVSKDRSSFQLHSRVPR